ncbi:hypothetical protein ACP4OV_013499 [Aristida adscensionis]
MEAQWVVILVLQHLLFLDGDRLPPFDVVVRSLKSSLAATLATHAPLAGRHGRLRHGPVHERVGVVELQGVRGRRLRVEEAAGGFLYIADAYMGLMRMGPNGGEADVLATEAGGAPLLFTNGVDVDQVTGEVYSPIAARRTRGCAHQMVTSFADSTGRITKYDPRTSQVTVLQSGVTYPNGISISSDRTHHLVVALTRPCKLLRYWIRGPKAGTSEMFTDLPGYPDNVRPESPDEKGGGLLCTERRLNSHLATVRSYKR